MGDSAPSAVAEAQPTVQVIEARNGTQPTQAPAKPFSWLDPHPIFVILFVGDEEKPFGIQKDFLCSKSRYFHDHFNKGKKNGAGEEREVENVVRLHDVSVETFAYVQNFLYTGHVVPDTDQEDQAIPTYDLLVSIWKLGNRLGIEGLCERALEAMAENKRLTQSIPATHILVQVWKDTPEGSSIRQLLLSWAAEYLRSSEERRSEFAKALPQELLSELVVAMSSSYGDFWSMPSDFNGSGGGSGGGGEGGGGAHGDDSRIGSNSNSSGNVNGKHYLEGEHDDTTKNGGDVNGVGNINYRGSPPVTKRARYFESYPLNSGGETSASTPATPSIIASFTPTTSSAGRKPTRTSLPSQRVVSKKRSHQVVDMNAFSPDQKLKFCSDLLTRMLSGPGFWTRLVGPFREAVDPSSEGIPDYFEKVKRPMDLGTIKANLDNKRYASPDEFVADMRQIFANVYMYWKKGDTIWTVCERLEKTFEEKYSQMNKWLGKLDGDETM